jgi:hypothetical protein
MYAGLMADQNYAGPTTPFQKAKGIWTFYVFPTGKQEEAPHYPDEASARAASWKAYREWQAKNCRY